jgi:3'-5' exonuclease
MKQILPLSEWLLLDIETVPMAPEYADLSEDYKSLWTEKAAKGFGEELPPEESYTRRAGILAEFGRIICISVAVFHLNEEKEWCLKLKTVSGDDEREVIQGFLDICDRFYRQHPQFGFAGHNIREFDIPYICRRMMALQMPLPAYLQLQTLKPWEINMLDTMQWWKFGDYKNYVSLKLLAATLGIPTPKDDIDGSMVQEVYYREKNLPRIVAYCQKDVICVAQIILRYYHLPLLDEQQVILG